MKYSLSVATLLLIATCGVAVNSSLQASNAEPVTTSSGNSTLPDAIWEGNARVRGVLRSTTDFSRPEKFELMQGGAGTQRTNFDRNAYSHEMTTLGFEGLKTFKLGNALFNKFWVASPSSTQASDGLGPFYNARACQSCHIKDGRGQVPQSDEKTASLVIQLKNSGNGQWGPDPTYGAQFQTSAVPGVEAEGLVSITYDTVTKTFNDGSKHGLRKPTYTLEKLAYGDLHPETILSPRLASAVHGLGLLESIDDAHVLAYADPDDSDGDGISGRPNWQLLENGQRKLGRFGHKAAMSSIREQNAHALFTDMGLSSSTDTLSNPHGDCTSAQRICNSLAHGEQSRLGKGEAPDQVVDLITFYTQNLAVPARRDVSDPDILAGKQLFYNSGCAGCHVPKHVTSRDTRQDELQFQLIWPYTDLLLHDMGPGLADHAGEGDANGSEWRTAPLWGIGLAMTVNPNTSFLHDGRAKTLMDAVLWHGGEAQASVDQVLNMSKKERSLLIRFLKSL